MTLPNVLFKDPDESKIYSVDFSQGLAATGESLSSFSYSWSSAGINLISSGVGSDSLTLAVSGGSSGNTYTLDLLVLTSAGNYLNESLKFAIQNLGYMDEMVVMLRYLINDLDTPSTYSDTRLMQTLLVAAKYVLLDLELQGQYSINSSNLTITPEPTSPTDLTQLALVNFTVLKAACMLDLAAVRIAAKTGGIIASLGPARLDTSKQLEGYKMLIEKGPCSTYDDTMFDYLLGTVNVKAILTPFVGNRFWGWREPQTIRYGR